MNYDTKAAGPELDALIAEKVMGWTRVERDSFDGYACCPANPTWYSDPNDIASSQHQVHEWHPRTDIADAMETIRPILDSRNAYEHGGGMGSVGMIWSPYQVRWEVELSWSDGYRVKASAKELPLAICRAAVIAVGRQKGVSDD